MENNELNGKELNLEEMDKAAGGKGPDITLLLGARGECIKNGHDFERISARYDVTKGYQVGKRKCKRCGEIGYFRCGAVDIEETPISKEEYVKYTRT